MGRAQRGTCHTMSDSDRPNHARVLVLGTVCTYLSDLCLSFPTADENLFFSMCDVTRFAARQELLEADSQVITRYSRRTSCTSLVPRDRRHPWRTQQAHSLPVRALPQPWAATRQAPHRAPHPKGTRHPTQPPPIGPCPRPHGASLPRRRIALPLTLFPSVNNK